MMFSELAGNSFFLILGIVFSWLTALTFIFVLMMRRYRRLTEGKKGERFDEILRELNKETKKNYQLIVKNQAAINLLKKIGKFNVQKVGLVRFNPFSQTGGNQSFSLALLNEENRGVVISSLHSREGTRLYAKMVDKGKINARRFSDEEKEAIDKAIKSFKVRL